MERVLVIMPLGKDQAVISKRRVLSDLFGDSIWLPEINEAVDPAFDLKSTIARLGDVCFVIADLSYERPSCYYELGIVQGLGIPTFLIAKKDTVLHQHHGRVHRYGGIEEYKKIVRRAHAEWGDQRGKAGFSRDCSIPISSNGS
ncbi:MAG: hypothetical protein AAF492_25920 [Verrucomicrobiota bacterium]